MRAWRHGAEVSLGPPKQRAVLGLLASRVNDVVCFEEIVDAVWGSAVPRTAANGVHTYIAGLRRILEPDGRRKPGELLASTGGGYLLVLDPGRIDAKRFVDSYTQAQRFRADGDVRQALHALESALQMWHGEAYANVPGPFAQIERTRLNELRLTATEQWADAMLAVGRAAEVAAVLADAVVKEPLREKLRCLLMVALYRSGRQADALRVFQETRQLLAEELGIEPGIELQSLHRQIMAGDQHLAARASTSGTVAVAEEHVVDVPRPAQLPSRARGFVGRQQELASLRWAVSVRHTRHHPSAARLAVIDGPAGVGKTTLALELAHQLSSQFPDGQLFVDLCGSSARRSPLTAQEALAFLLRSLGVDDARQPADVADLVVLYRSLLQGRRVLVVLDDAVDAHHLRPLIPPAPSYALTTSRRRQCELASRDGAYRIGLQPLVSAECVKLLAYLASPERIGSETHAARLAELCGRLPLALRIAAESLAANPDVSLPELVARYSARRSRLDLLGVAGDAAASVRTALEASYRRLPTEAARMFRLLGLYRGPLITVPLAATLAGTAQECAGRQLALLANRHLLEGVGDCRYRLPDLVGIYAAECAEEEPYSNRSAALARLAGAAASCTVSAATRTDRP